MELFHVGTRAIASGQALQTHRVATAQVDLLELVGLALNGNCPARTALLTERGRLRRRFQADPNSQLAFIEVIFERVRLRVAPRLPSRLEAVFLWPTLGLALDFRERYRPEGVIHRCVLEKGRPLWRDAAYVAAGMDLAAPVDEQIQKIEHRAVQYWEADAHISYPEVLVRGTVLVTEVLPLGTE